MCIEKSLFMKKLLRFILAVAFVPAAYAQQPLQEQQIPKDLVQYVQNAWQAGISQKQIQQNAVNAGWPVGAIAGAIASVVDAGAVKTTSRAATPISAIEKDPANITQPPWGAAPPAAASTAKSSGPAQAVAVQARLSEGGTPKIPAAVDRGVPDDYQIGAGDELQISVWKEPDASVPSVVVRPDGRITMPMLKDFSVIGLTPTQAEKVITEQLNRFITAADVTVIVKAINSKKIYVVGGVKKEGPIPYTYRMTILQALSEAGGLTDYAKKKKIYVLRHENGRDFQFPFDYDAALKGLRMELNRTLIPGDTLVVPK